jgi:1-deoxy-D-xylulose-5-phosphate reductoisomerase
MMIVESMIDVLCIGLDYCWIFGHGGFPAWGVAGAASACTFDTATSWTFEPLDSVTFPAVELARQAGTTGGCLPAIYNAANEEALASFVAGNTSFLSIVDTIGQVLGEANDWQKDPADVAEVLAAEDWARARARELVGRN